MNDTAYTDDELVFFEYLDELRESGVTNMYGAAPFLQAEFSLDQKKAEQILLRWMKTFSDRHPPKN